LRGPDDVRLVTQKLDVNHGTSLSAPLTHLRVRRVVSQVVTSPEW